MVKWSVVLCLLATSAWSQPGSDSEGKTCEETVDLSERGQFHRLHFECDESARAATQPATPPVHLPNSQHALAVPLTKVSLLDKAQKALFTEMINRCPLGWALEREWVTPADKGFTLHAQIRCADQVTG